MTTQTVTLTDAAGLTDTLARHLAKLRSLSDAVGLTDTITEHTSHRPVLLNTVGISDYVRRHYRILLPNAVDLDSSLDLFSTLIQYDTWRPVLSPDKQLILACRTPLGEHDTPTGFTHMTLWTFHNDGSNENVVLNVPSSLGLVSYGHPEWSPDASNVVIYGQDSGHYHIILLDTSRYDRPLT